MADSDSRDPASLRARHTEWGDPVPCDPNEFSGVKGFGIAATPPLSLRLSFQLPKKNGRLRLKASDD